MLLLISHLDDILKLFKTSFIYRKDNNTMKTKNLKNIPFLLTVFVDILMIIAVFYLMNYVQHLLQSDVKINLTEIVT